MTSRSSRERIKRRQSNKDSNSSIATAQKIQVLFTGIIALATVLYVIVTFDTLSQIKNQNLQNKQTINEMKDSNKIMRDAYSEAIKNNQIVKTQMEIEIEKYFDEKLQLHYDLKNERDRIAKEISKKIVERRLPQKSFTTFPEYKFFQDKMTANYEGLVALSKRYAPLGGRLARFANTIPSERDLTPPAPPTNVRVSISN